MITTLLGTLVDAEPALRRVCALPLATKDIPDGLTPKTKYALAKLARLVSVETKHFADEQVALFTRLSITQGQPIGSIDPRVWAEYQQQIRLLITVPVTLDWDPVDSRDVPLALASDLVDLGPLCDLQPPE